ncbi:AMP-binding protein [Rhodovulum kholense]|uniref:4-coumarate--CoA ligase n=1 Tax=Rhodovulum kholense TaxID=453584 RepID=A0A8E2VN90_9RHOB|nr:AMP-binding protein [Rhodovulum kholense]PTW50673.1 4-coumarate--CoA ligase [Rhodovulum kholense]
MIVHSSRFAPVPLTGLSVTERLFRGLTSRPDEVVLVDGPSGQGLTAGALMDRIRRLGGGLAARGIGKGAVVALMAPNSPDFVTVFHGVAYAGGTVTPVNPTYTAEELAFQLKDSGARLLVTVPACLDTARAGAAAAGLSDIAVIGAEAPDRGAVPLEALMGPRLVAQVPLDVARDIAVLPYSSGTTGLPKGVRLSHRNLVVNIDQGLAACDMRPGDWTVGFLPFFHIYGLTVLMNMVLGNGASLVTMPRFDLELFLRLVQERRTRELYIVPPVATALARHPLVGQFDLGAVETVICAAAPLGAAQGAELAARLGCRVMQGWGMTELSPIGTMSAPGRDKPGAVGVALPNTELRIVDPETGADLGPDQPGELWLRGPQVMQGYLNAPEATAATLTPDGWLKTGDLASIDAEGFVTLHDRLKELIKVKGFAVAPAELEAVLLTHPDVLDAAVVGRSDPEAGERPVAHVVPRPGADADAEALKAHVLAHLSHFKALAEVHFVEAVPKSASGKILRRLLRDAA